MTTELTSDSCSNYKLSRYVVPLDSMAAGPDGSVRLVFSTRSGRTVAMPEEVWDRLVHGSFEDIEPERLSMLFACELVVPEAEDEFRSILEENRAAVLDNSNLSVTLQPGAACQLGCGYCGQEHSNTFMSDEVQAGVLDRLTGKIRDGNGKFRTLSVTWYGGEPLLGLRQIRTMTPRIIEIARRHSLEYSAGMITNGMMLTRKIFDEVTEKHRVRSFQITLDGVAAAHDLRRVTKSGRPTFERIFGNILGAVESPLFSQMRCALSIRCNIDRHNIDHIEGLIDQAATAGLAGKVTFDFSPVVDWGEVTGSTESVAKDTFARREIRWLARLADLGFTVDTLPSRKFGSCMIVDPDADVVDANGTVYPCWEMPYSSPYQNDGKYFVGRIGIRDDDGSIAWGRDWHDQVESDRFWCNRCTFFPVCGGSCPKSWLQGTPACPSFKLNITDRVALSVLTAGTDR